MCGRVGLSALLRPCARQAAWMCKARAATALLTFLGPFPSNPTRLWGHTCSVHAAVPSQRRRPQSTRCPRHPARPKSGRARAPAAAPTPTPAARSGPAPERPRSSAAGPARSSSSLSRVCELIPKNTLARLQYRTVKYSTLYTTIGLAWSPAAASLRLYLSLLCSLLARIRSSGRCTSPNTTSNH